MKPDNNHDKFRLIESVIILNMLQQPSCFINIKDKSKKNLTTIKEVNTKFKNEKSEIKTEFTLSMKEVTIDDVKESTNNIDKISATTNNISKIPKKTNADNLENLISKIPIIIAEKKIDIPIESTFKLKNGAFDIKNIKNDIYITNTKLLPMYGEDDCYASLNRKLFLEGFVRNKLDFYIAKDVNDNMINLDTECVIIYIPFKCTTSINCIVPPVFSKEKELDYIPIHISSECSNINNECLNERNNQSNEYIDCDTTPINCEIVKAKIYETYTLVDKKPFSEKFPLEMNFHIIKERILLNLSLTLIQKQDIVINHRKNSNKSV